MKLERQAIRNDFKVRRVMEKAHEESKRKRNGVAIECKSSKNVKPVLRKIKREKILLEVQNETDQVECKDAITVKIEQKEKELLEESKQQEQSQEGVIFEASLI